MADPDGAATIERLLQYISKIFKEPEPSSGMKSADKKIDVALLKNIAAGEGDEDLHFIWKRNGEQITMFLSTPLLPMSDLEIEFTLRYFLPEIEKEVLTYKGGG